MVHQNHFGGLKVDPTLVNLKPKPLWWTIEKGSGFSVVDCREGCTVQSEPFILTINGSNLLNLLPVKV